MKRTIYRDCIDGKVVTKKEVEDDPAETETEHVPARKYPHTTYRSCETGLFVTKAYADHHKETTVEIEVR
jgi:hypothetical protein